MSKQSINLPYFLLTGMVMVAIIAGSIVIYPAIRNLQQIRREADAAAATLSERQDFLRTLDRDLADLQAQAAAEKEAAIALPADESFDDVLRLLQRSAGEAGVAVSVVRNNAKTQEASYAAARARGESMGLPAGVSPLGISMEARGTYQQTRVFLEQLDRSIRLFDVLSLQLKRDPAQADLLTGQFDIRFFKYSEPL